MVDPVVDQSRRYHPALTGVRGFAMLLVMALHLMVLEPANAAQSRFHFFAEGGWIGVDLFFTLSGFLITGILLDTTDRADFFSRFYIRRATRIFPLFYAICIFSFIILPNLPQLPSEKLARFGTVGTDEIFYWVFLSNYAIAQEGIFRHGIMDVTWSLAIEEQFYLIWPLTVYLFKARLKAICIALFILSTMLRLHAVDVHENYNAIYVTSWYRLEPLVAGAFVAALVRTPLQSGDLARRFRMAIAVGFVGFALCCHADESLAYSFSPHVSGAGFSFLAIFCAGLIGEVYLRPDRNWARFFTIRFFRFIGKISFALYLFHLPVRAAIRDLWITPEWIGKTPLYGMSGQLLFYVVAGSIAIFLAFLSYHCFEKHITKWGVKITQ